MARPRPTTYGDDSAQGAGSRQMTVEEARRIAVNIARLPELLGDLSARSPRRGLP